LPSEKKEVKNREESFVKGVVCPVKIGGSSDMQLYQNFPLPIFHWAQAAPTRYGDRSHCTDDRQTTLYGAVMCMNRRNISLALQEAIPLKMAEVLLKLL